jgi:thioredoxin-related protein
MVKIEHIKQLFSWSLPVLFVLSMILLFIYKDLFVEFTSSRMQHQITPISKGIFADSVDRLFNYSKTSSEFKFTILSFSAGGCMICKKMEKELKEIDRTHSRRINIVNMNMTYQRGLRWGKYFGVVMIPTQIVMNREGKEIFRHTGFISHTDILLKLE